MTDEECELYGGLAGAHLLVDEYDFGQGISVSRTFAHLFAPFMMAFSPAEKGMPHPGPWRAANGGFAFDIHAQIHVPKEFAPPDWFNRLNTVWWFVALLRFRSTSNLAVPVVASGPFSRAKEGEEIQFWPMEVEQLNPDADEKISVDDLDWIKRHWWNSGKLMNRSAEFNLLFQANDRCMFKQSREMALLSLWGALEGMFSPAKVELRFRVSANIAAYLEPPGRMRLELQKQVAKLYDARSQAAHGGTDLPTDALRDSYSLTKRVIAKVIETNEVPTRERLDAALFGSDAT